MYHNIHRRRQSNECKFTWKQAKSSCVSLQNHTKRHKTDDDSYVVRMCQIGVNFLSTAKILLISYMLHTTTRASRLTLVLGRLSHHRGRTKEAKEVLLHHRNILALRLVLSLYRYINHRSAHTYKGTPAACRLSNRARGGEEEEESRTRHATIMYSLGFLLYGLALMVGDKVREEQQPRSAYMYVCLY